MSPCPRTANHRRVHPPAGDSQRRCGQRKYSSQFRIHFRDDAARGLNPPVLPRPNRKRRRRQSTANGKSPGLRNRSFSMRITTGSRSDLKAWTASPPFQPTGGRPARQGRTDRHAPGKRRNQFQWRIYARRFDDKAGVMGISAFDALKAQGATPSFQYQDFIRRRREAGSPHLGEIIDLQKSCCNPRRDHLRWAGASVRPKGSSLRRARRSKRRVTVSWAEASAAQRPLWKLGAESGDAAATSAVFDER